MLWHYEKDNAQNGPVSEEELLALHQQGTIRSHNLVWREGMTDWSPMADCFPNLGSGSAGEQASCPTCGALVGADHLIPSGETQVCPQCKDEYAQGLREGLSQPVRRSGARGTGGQTPNGGLRQMGRETLAGNWGMAVLVTFLYFFLQQVGGIIPLLGQLATFLIYGPLSLGFMAYYVGLHRGEPVEVGTLFSGFSRFLQGLGIYFVTTLLVSLAAMAAAIPGLVLIGLAYSGNNSVPEESPMFLAGIFVAIVPAALVGTYMYLRYALVYYIANDHPELGVMGTIKRSTEMMMNRKGKLFMLALSFIGWHLLGALALGIGLLWSMSYMWAAFAAFYDDIGEDA
jgi:uncharacterized membrane protein